jgi:hypothetical protein
VCQLRGDLPAVLPVGGAGGRPGAGVVADGVRRAAAGRRLEEVGAGIPDARRALARPSWRLLGALGYLWFDISVRWIAFAAVGPLPSPAPLVVAYLAGYLANAIPIPGGIGVLDAGPVGSLALYGLPVTHAAAAVLVYHAIAFWIPTLGGARRRAARPACRGRPRPTPEAASQRSDSSHRPSWVIAACGPRASVPDRSSHARPGAWSSSTGSPSSRSGCVADSVRGSYRPCAGAARTDSAAMPRGAGSSARSSSAGLRRSTSQRRRGPCLAGRPSSAAISSAAVTASDAFVVAPISAPATRP